MKMELDYSEHNWVFSFEPENDMEQCALDFLATRPTDQVIILNTRLGLFKREEKKCQT